MGLMDERYWVGRCSLIAADELAKIVDAQVSTVNRRLLAQYEDEMVDYIEVGRGTRSKRRWCLTSSGVKAEYPVWEKMQRQPGPDGHAHYALSAELDSHTHPPWWVSKEGVGRLYKRLEVVQACYQLFPDLFQGEGEAWHQGPGTLLPLTWQWLKASQLVDAVGTYDGPAGQHKIGFCWVGRQLDKTRLVEKWNERFASRRLERVSTAEFWERRRDRETEPRDWDYDDTPQLDGYVMCGADGFAFYNAHKFIPRNWYMRQPMFLWVETGTGLKMPKGVVTPGVDEVTDAVYDKPVGKPEYLCPDRRKDGEPERTRPPLPPFITRTAPLSSVLGTRIFGLAEEWSGLTAGQFQRVCREGGGNIEATLMALVDSELMRVIKGMYYLGRGGEIYVADRDGVHVKSVRGRINTDITQDHREVAPHRRHTLGRNDMMVAMKSAGLLVYAGWRTLRNIPDVTQVPPDAVMMAKNNFGEVVVFLEYERSAIKPSRVSNKVGPYLKLAQEGQPTWVAFVCETEAGAQTFRAEIASIYREQGIPLSAMVTTIDQLKKGPIRGAETIWEVHGVPLEMW